MCPQHYITTKIIDRRQGGSMFHVIYTKQLNIGAEIETRQHFSNLMWSNFSEWSVVSFLFLPGKSGICCSASAAGFTVMCGERPNLVFNILLFTFLSPFCHFTDIVVLSLTFSRSSWPCMHNKRHWASAMRLANYTFAWISRIDILLVFWYILAGKCILKFIYPASAKQHILWDIMCTTALLIAVTTHLPQTTSVMKNDKVNDKVKEFKNTT